MRAKKPRSCQQVACLGPGSVGGVGLNIVMMMIVGGVGLISIITLWLEAPGPKRNKSNNNKKTQKSNKVWKGTKKYEKGWKSTTKKAKKDHMVGRLRSMDLIWTWEFYTYNHHISWSMPLKNDQNDRHPKEPLEERWRHKLVIHGSFTINKSQSDKTALHCIIVFAKIIRR